MKKIIYTKFPIINNKNEDQKAHELYAEIYPTVLSNRLNTFVSMPITSGGARRELDPAKNLGEIIKRNKEFAKIIASLFKDFITTETVTLPYNLSYRKTWSELDMLLFWSYYISGINPEHAYEFSSIVASGKLVNNQLFNDHISPREIRLKEYKQFINSFISYIRMKKLSINPVTELIVLPDYEYSLGCTAELLLAKQLDIPVRRVLINANSNAYVDIIRIATWLSEKHIIQGKDHQQHEVIFLREID